MSLVFGKLSRFDVNVVDADEQADSNQLEEIFVVVVVSKHVQDVNSTCPYLCLSHSFLENNILDRMAAV